jgi:dipeptidyl aminopeptidase/acylaminoacyl peptidase
VKAPRVLAAGLLLLGALLAAGVARAGKTIIVLDAETGAGREVFSGRGKKLRSRSGPGLFPAILVSVAPNGKRLAWLRLLDPAGERAELTVAKARRGRARVLTGGLDGRPLEVAWRPNGKELIFEHRDAASGRSDLHLAATKGRKRTCVTGELAGSASPPGGTTTIRATRDRVAFRWEGTLMLLDDGGLHDLGATLADGTPGRDFLFRPDGSLLFTWERGEETDLHLAAGTMVARRAEAVAAWAAAGERFAWASGSRLTIVGPDGERVVEPGGAILGFRLHRTGSAAVVVAEGAAARLFHEETELLPGVALSAVDDLRFSPAGDALLVRATSAGERILRRIDLAGGGATAPPQAPGQLGATALFSPDGALVLHVRIGEDGEGALLLWDHASGDVRDLTAESGVPGTPSTARFSESTGDLLFSTVAAFDAGRRLFVWRRKRDRIDPVTPVGLSAGGFLFTR